MFRLKRGPAVGRHPEDTVNFLRRFSLVCIGQSIIEAQTKRLSDHTEANVGGSISKRVCLVGLSTIDLGPVDSRP